jgi:hypothetical protein
MTLQSLLMKIAICKAAKVMQKLCKSEVKVDVDQA